MKSTPALLTSRQAELPAQFFGAHHLLARASYVGGHEKLPSDGHESARWRS